MSGSNPLDECTFIPIDEELMYFTVFYDINDVEGILLEGYAGTEYIYRANGMESSPRLRLGGRPIGFRVWQGDGGIPLQPLQIAIVYNSCNCPASTFMLNAQPTDM